MKNKFKFLALGLLTALVVFQNCSQPLDLTENSSLSSYGTLLITSQPSNLSLAYGGSGTLWVSAISYASSTLSYQWYKDGSPISGATGSSLALSNVDSSQQASYYCRITDGNSSVDSGAAYVYVGLGSDSSSSGTILITAQPTNVTSQINGYASFAVTARDTAGKTLYYQWYRNGVAVDSGNGASLYLSALRRATHEGYYTVIITNGTDSLQSSTVSLVLSGGSIPCDGGSIYGEHCYIVYGTPTTHANAATTCSAAGGYLAKLTSLNETLFVQNLTYASTWIGASDEVTEGVFLWRDGTSLVYARWGAGEPSNTNNEDCVEIRADGYWNDLSCSLTRQFVCEFE